MTIVQLLMLLSAGLTAADQLGQATQKLFALVQKLVSEGRTELTDDEVREVMAARHAMENSLIADLDAAAQRPKTG